MMNYLKSDIRMIVDVANTTCAAFAQLPSFPHNKSLFIIENGPFQDLIPYTNYSSAYSGQSQISLFWPIHELPTPLTIQSRIRQFVWEPDISRHSILRDSFLCSESTRRNSRLTPRSNGCSTQE